MDSTDSAPSTPSAMPLADHSTPGPLADHSTPGLLTVSSLPRFGSTPAGKAAGAGYITRKTYTQGPGPEKLNGMSTKIVC